MIRLDAFTSSELSALECGLFATENQILLYPDLVALWNELRDELWQRRRQTDPPGVESIRPKRIVVGKHSWE